MIIQNLDEVEDFRSFGRNQQISLDCRPVLTFNAKPALEVQTHRSEARQTAEVLGASQVELAAVGEALAILTEDDARDQFSKTLAFMQVSVKLRRQHRVVTVP